MSRTVTIFYPEDSAMGVREISYDYSSVIALAFPRNKLQTAAQRNLAEKPGIYFLLGEKDDEPAVYIGETERGIQRVKHHKAKKQWWQSCVLITSSKDDGSLDKTGVKYLEVYFMLVRSFKNGCSECIGMEYLNDVLECHPEEDTEFLRKVVQSLDEDSTMDEAKSNILSLLKEEFDGKN